MFPNPLPSILVIDHSSEHDKLGVMCHMLDDSNMEIEVEDKIYYLIENRDIIGMYR
jgi:hypothetical protein